MAQRTRQSLITLPMRLYGSFAGKEGSVANEITYHSAADSGLTVYAMLENTTGQLYNGSSFEDPVSGNWGTYDLPMTEQDTSTGIFRCTMPSVAAGTYSFIIRLQAGGSPAVTDSVLGSSGFFIWTGSAIDLTSSSSEGIWTYANNAPTVNTMAHYLVSIDAVLSGITNTDTANEVAFKNRSGTEVRRVTYGSADGSRTASTISN